MKIRTLTILGFALAIHTMGCSSPVSEEEESPSVDVAELNPKQILLWLGKLFSKVKAGTKFPFHLWSPSSKVLVGGKLQAPKAASSVVNQSVANLWKLSQADLSAFGRLVSRASYQAGSTLMDGGFPKQAYYNGESYPGVILEPLSNDALKGLLTRMGQLRSGPNNKTPRVGMNHFLMTNGTNTVFDTAEGRRISLVFDGMRRSGSPPSVEIMASTKMSPLEMLFADSSVDGLDFDYSRFLKQGWGRHVAIGELDLAEDGRASILRLADTCGGAQHAIVEKAIKGYMETLAIDTSALRVLWQ